MPAVTSSVIAQIEHSAADQELTITFTSGRRYAYSGVPLSVYAALLAAESKGVFFNEHIRDTYPATELSGRRGPAR